MATRYELSKPAAGGPWTIVVLDEVSRELWDGSGYLTKAGARRAARRAMRRKTTANPSGVVTITGSL